MYCPDRFDQLSEIEDQINAANGVILATCTSGLGASPVSTETAYNELSVYFDGSYFVGHKPPQDTGISAYPFAAIIDLETGEVALRDSSAQMTPGAIVAYVEMLNND
jgi:hypothetical protein